MGEILNYTVDRGMECAVKTNGTLLDEKVLDTIDKHAKFSISIDGDQTAHDNIRGTGTFRRAITTAILLKEKGYRIGFHYVIQPENVNSLDIMMEWALKHDIKMGTDLVQPIGNAAEYKDFKLSIEEAEKILSTLKRRSDYFFEKMHKHHRLNIFDIEFFKPFFDSCEGGKALLHIEANGDIYPCPTLAAIKRYKIGNIRDITSFSDFWETNEELNKFRNLTIWSNFENCLKCPFNDICNLKCVAISTVLYGKPHVCGATGAAKALLSLTLDKCKNH